MYFPINTFNVTTVMTIWPNRIYLAQEYPSAIKQSFAVMYINIIVLLPYYSKQSSLNFSNNTQTFLLEQLKTLSKTQRSQILSFKCCFSVVGIRKTFYYEISSRQIY